MMRAALFLHCGGSTLDKYEVKLLSRALRDMDGIYGYIAQSLQEPGTASDLLDEIEKQILSLEYLTFRCPERRTGVYAGKGYRQLLVHNYNIIYRVDEAKKIVLIVTVRYAKSSF